MNYLGIDVGGTNIKGGIIDENGKVIKKLMVKCEYEKGEDVVIDVICNLITELTRDGNYMHDSVGIALPGMIDAAAGMVTYSNNLRWKNVNIVKKIYSKIGVLCLIENDANVAALGEATFGAGKKFKHSVMITLGTGVGGGIIFDGKLFDKGRMHAELGHTMLVYNGEPCTCGRKGCFEAYASATALVRETKKAMLQNPQSKMWTKISDINHVSGKTAFEYRLVDETAKRVVDNYIDMLGEGIIDIVNTFRPEAIILGGGISKEGKVLTEPLQKKIDAEVYGTSIFPNRATILEASLGYDAGLVGAASLVIYNLKSINIQNL